MDYNGQAQGQLQACAKKIDVKNVLVLTSMKWHILKICYMLLAVMHYLLHSFKFS
jgi:hypothetical protein